MPRILQSLHPISTRPESQEGLKHMQTAQARRGTTLSCARISRRVETVHPRSAARWIGMSRISRRVETVSCTLQRTCPMSARISRRVETRIYPPRLSRGTSTPRPESQEGLKRVEEGEVEAFSTFATRISRRVETFFA